MIAACSQIGAEAARTTDHSALKSRLQAVCLLGLVPWERLAASASVSCLLGAPFLTSTLSILSFVRRSVVHARVFS
jgi:hypothetical protein